MLIPLVLFAVHIVYGAQPTCPNGQKPKTEANGSVVQCLPGSDICGSEYLCFFSGMNFFCCPNNEPTLQHPPSCPATRTTVLDSHGLPLKCSPRTRTCPQETMDCLDVGLGYVCCEKEKESQIAVKPHKSEGKTRRLKTSRPSIPHSECPKSSLGVLNAHGNSVLCGKSNKCDGFGQFCYRQKNKKAICCEKYQSAKSILDSTAESTTIRPSTKARATKKHSHQPKHVSIVVKPSAAGSNLHQGAVQGAAPVLKSSRVSSTTKRPFIQNNRGRKTIVLVKQLTEVANKDETEKSSTDHIIVFTTTQKTTTLKPTTQKKRPRVHAVRTFSRRHEAKPHVRTFSRSQSEELLNQEKKAMAQNYLMHQIQNGWPYDDRFYRPDTNPFTHQERSDVAQLRFINN